MAAMITVPDMLAAALRELVRLAGEPDPAAVDYIRAHSKALAEARIALCFWDAEQAIAKHRAQKEKKAPR